MIKMKRKIFWRILSYKAVSDRDSKIRKRPLNQATKAMEKLRSQYSLSMMTMMKNKNKGSKKGSSFQAMEEQ